MGWIASKNRCAESAERLQHAFTGRDRSAVAGDHGDEWRAIRTMQERDVCASVRRERTQ